MKTLDDNNKHQIKSGTLIEWIDDGDLYIILNVDENNLTTYWTTETLSSEQSIFKLQIRHWHNNLDRGHCRIVE